MKYSGRRMPFQLQSYYVNCELNQYIALAVYLQKCERKTLLKNV